MKHRFPGPTPEMLIQQLWNTAVAFACRIVFQVIVMLAVRVKDHILSTEPWEIHFVVGRKAEWIGTAEGLTADCSVISGS